VPALVRNSLGFRTVRLEDLGTGAWEARFVNPRVHTHVGPPSLRSLIPGAYGCRAEQGMGAPPT